MRSVSFTLGALAALASLARALTTTEGVAGYSYQVEYYPSVYNTSADFCLDWEMECDNFVDNLGATVMQLKCDWTANTSQSRTSPSRTLPRLHTPLTPRTSSA